MSFKDGWTGKQIGPIKPDDSASGCQVFCVCACVCVHGVCACVSLHSLQREPSRSQTGKGGEDRNAHSSGVHLSVPVQCLRKCTLILAIKEQIVRGAMPARTAAVEWSGEGGGGGGRARERKRGG